MVFHLPSFHTSLHHTYYDKQESRDFHDGLAETEGIHRDKFTWSHPMAMAESNHQKLRYQQWRYCMVLYLIRLGVPYISRIHTAYIGECLHFSWVIKHIFPGCEPLSFARTPFITNQDNSNVCFPIPKAGFHIHRAFFSAKQKSGLAQSETMALVMSKKLS